MDRRIERLPLNERHGETDKQAFPTQEIEMHTLGAVLDSLTPTENSEVSPQTRIEQLEQELPPLEGENRGPYLNYKHLKELTEMFKKTGRGHPARLTEWLVKNNFVNDRGVGIKRSAIIQFINNPDRSRKKGRPPKKDRKPREQKEEPTRDLRWSIDPEWCAAMLIAYNRGCTGRRVAEILTDLSFKTAPDTPSYEYEISVYDVVSSSTSL